MAQHDYVIANGTGAAVRSDLNNGLSAIVTQNSGATEPATTYAFMRWADTTAGVMKMRNSANNAWITLYQLDGEWTNIAFENGTAAAPSIYFKDSGTDTGFYSPGTDQVGISTGGTARLTIDSNGNVNIDSNTLYVDAANNRVGLGTSSPSSALDVAGAISLGAVALPSAGTARIFSRNTDSNLYIQTGSGNTLNLLDGSQNTMASFGASTITLQTGNSPRLTIDSSGRVGIGSTVPGYPLTVVSDGASQVLRVCGRSSDNNSNIAFSSNNQGTDYAFLSSGPTFLAAAVNGSERCRIDSSGRLLVGTSTSTSVGGAAALSQIETGANIGLSVLRRSDTPIIAFGRTGGSGSTIVSNGDELGTIRFAGADGSTINSYGASISCAVDGTPGANDMPGRLVFSTTSDGASSPTTRVILSAGGDFFPNTDNVSALGKSGQRWQAVWAANGTIQTSDVRTKTEVSTSTLGTDFVKSLRPVSYKWIEGGKRETLERDENNEAIFESVPGQRTHWGFIAQEVKEAVDAAGVDFGGWVLTDKDNPDSQQALRYDQFIAPLTKALQEALAKIETLEAKVAALEAS